MTSKAETSSFEVSVEFKRGWIKGWTENKPDTDETRARAETAFFEWAQRKIGEVFDAAEANNGD
jgi:hypothetical protein